MSSILFVGKGADFCAREINYTNGLTGAWERNACNGACVATADLRQFAEVGVLQSIRHMYRTLLGSSLTGITGAARRSTSMSHFLRKASRRPKTRDTP